jgi:hypothetical protein
VWMVVDWDELDCRWLGVDVALLFVSVVYQHFVYSRGGIACHESQIL